MPYFASERSFAQFRLPEETRSIVGFGSTPVSISLHVSQAGSVPSTIAQLHHLYPASGPAQSVPHVHFLCTPLQATIIVVSASGAFYTAAFNPQKGGMCEQRT